MTKIVKKGDMWECDNWRRVTLLSIIKQSIWSRESTRKEQAGFRPRRGTHRDARADIFVEKYNSTVTWVDLPHISALRRLRERL